MLAPEHTRRFRRPAPALGLAAALATLVLAVVLAPAAQAGSYPVAHNGRIAFIGLDRNGSPTIQTVGGLGLKPAALPSLQRNPGHPIFDPTGRWIAFADEHFCPDTPPPNPSSCPSSFTPWLVRAGGSHMRRVAESGSPTGFSPDGRRLLLEAGEVVSVRVKGGGLKNLGAGEDGVFSPDGTSIAFAALAGSYGSGIRGISLMRANGDGRVTLTSPAPPMSDSDPTFSPIGRRVAFTRFNYTTGVSDVYSIKTDGSGLLNLTSGLAANVGNSDFSPDGRHLVVEVAEVSQGQNGPQVSETLYRMGSNGSEPRRLMAFPLSYATQPNWGPVYRCAGKVATIVGDDGPETIKGTRHADVIVGNGGADRIEGRGGRDRICGGHGSDKLLGGGDEDKLVGGPGKDVQRP